MKIQSPTSKVQSPVHVLAHAPSETNWTMHGSDFSPTVFFLLYFSLFW